MSTSAPSAPSTPYQPPEELQKRAFAELEAATSEELEGAQRCYEACNRALGGRSGVTGSPLPTWEAMTNPLVKYSWLEVYRSEAAHHVREIDGAVKELRAARREQVGRLLAEPQLAAMVDGNYLTLLKRLAEQDMEAEVLGMLIRQLVGLQHASAQKSWELAELRACVAGLHNTLAKESGLTTGHVMLLVAAAHHLRERGHPRSAELLEQCVTGSAEVEPGRMFEVRWLDVKPLTPEELAVVALTVEARRNPSPTGLPYTAEQLAAWEHLEQLAPHRIKDGMVECTNRERAEADKQCRAMCATGLAPLEAPPQKPAPRPAPAAQKPSVGRVVHFTDPAYGGPFAAIITDVHEEVVDLVVFPPPRAPGAYIIQAGVALSPLGDAPHPGCWNWAPHV